VFHRLDNQQRPRHQRQALVQPVAIRPSWVWMNSPATDVPPQATISTSQNPAAG
jgi:hypothetical protein